MELNQVRKVLVFGGASDERLVSVASAQGLASSYTFDSLCYFDTQGRGFDVTSEALMAHEKAFQNEFRPQSEAAFQSFEQGFTKWKGAVLFLGFHGTEGEDGQMQSALEKAGIAYTGSDSKSSHICFDKLLAKRAAESANLRTAAEVKFNTAQDLRPIRSQLEKLILKSGKVVIKPIRSGSSFGLFIVDSLTKLDAVLQQVIATSYGDFVAEEFIEGRELTVAVIQTPEGLKPLPPSEVVLETGASFDYAGKYFGRAKEITPAQLQPAEKALAQEMALHAHKALKCFGYSRTDMILTSTGPCFLETNTLPGLTKMSFVPQQLHAAGIPMRDFVEGQLKLALSRV
jgi:D-alanine-D-alanine ligase